MPVPKRTNRLSLLLVAVFAAAAAPAALAAPPSNTTPPTINGTAAQGQTLTATNGTWANNPTAYQYQWQRCAPSGLGCANIGGATQQSYVVRPADVGRTLRVRVRAVNADGATDARSAPTEVVTGAGPGAPQNTARPTITGSGDPRVGEELTAENGTWTGSPTSFAYQWQRCDVDAVSCFNVTGATGKTYGVRIADLGFRLRVVVRATNARGSATATSLPTDVVGPTTPITNDRPTLRIVSVRFVGNRVYARFRICDDDARNLTILATDARPRRVSQTRRFSTRIAPSPCGAYTRNWVPAVRFRGRPYTVTLRARDVSGQTSAPARRTFR
jgi:Ig domain of plant-specific actin-binding protein